jgi:Na+-transporting NADH:ubiquinone oxidoreductase subunit NqrD
MKEIEPVKTVTNTAASHGAWSPLAVLAGGSLLVTATSRTAFALIAAVSLLWVYGFSAYGFFLCGKLFSGRLRMSAFLLFEGFVSSLFLLLLWLLNPLLALETFFFVILAALCCAGSGQSGRFDEKTAREALTAGLKEALVLAGLCLSFALIREPLGSGSLSFPGGGADFVAIALFGKAFVPLRVFSVSGGGLILLGYCAALFRFVWWKKTGQEDNG